MCLNFYLYLYLYSTGVAPVDEHHSNTSGRPHCPQLASSLQGSSSFKYIFSEMEQIPLPFPKYSVLHWNTTCIPSKDKSGLKIHSFKVPANSRPMSSSRRRWDYTWLFLLSCFAEADDYQTKLTIKGFSLNIGPSITDPRNQIQSWKSPLRRAELKMLKMSSPRRAADFHLAKICGGIVAVFIVCNLPRLAIGGFEVWRCKKQIRCNMPDYLYSFIGVLVKKIFVFSG